MKPTRALVLCALAAGFGACGTGGAADSLRPDDPTVASSIDEPSCLVPEDHGSPLVVDWNPEQRGDLEVAMKQGGVVVAYDCDSFQVLPNCTVPATYGFMGMNRKERVIQLRNADEVAANLPMSGAKLGGGMKRGSTLDVALVMVGKVMTTRKTASHDALEGDCKGATHFVRGATVGAFATRTRTDASTEAAAAIFGFGAEAGATSSKSVLHRDGDLQACQTSTPDATSPPQSCSALLRINLTAIAPGKAGPEPERGILLAHEQCAPGFAFDDGRCARLASDAPYQCAPDDVNGCVAQCRVGHPGSCNNAGSLYYRGAGVKQNLKKAFRLFRKSCKAGFGMGCFNLGYMQVEGVGVRKNFANARSSYTRACDLGESAGCSELGWMSMAGVGMDPDFTAAKKLFVGACVEGFPSACVNLAYMYSSGTGVKKDYERALAFNMQACEGGGPGGCAALALMYKRGWGLKADDKEAFAFYRRACEGGSGVGCNGLGLLYVEGAGVDKDVGRGVELFAQACAAGSRDGCYDLGLAFAGEIQGVSKDDVRATRAFGEACELGHLVSCKELAVALMVGRGVQKDREQGLELMQRVCDGGDQVTCAAVQKLR